MCWLRGASEIISRTPLHYSAKAGHPKCVRLLLRYGANPNARDADGYTPLHYICQFHNPSGSETRERVWLCLTSLLEFGASKRALTSSGYTPLILARQQQNAVCADELLKQELQLQPLLVLCRNVVSALIHSQFLKKPHQLWIPESLKRYLLFEDITTLWTVDQK